MSVYAYFCCTDCKVCLWLGKAINWGDDGTGPKTFSIGNPPDNVNWKSETLNRVLWKLLAEHCGHSIRVVLEHDFTLLLETDNYQEIGGDSDADIRFEDYLRQE